MHLDDNPIPPTITLAHSRTHSHEPANLPLGHTDLASRERRDWLWIPFYYIYIPHNQMASHALYTSIRQAASNQQKQCTRFDMWKELTMMMMAFRFDVVVVARATTCNHEPTIHQRSKRTTKPNPTDDDSDRKGETRGTLLRRMVENAHHSSRTEPTKVCGGWWYGRGTLYYGRFICLEFHRQPSVVYKHPTPSVRLRFGLHLVV